MNYQYYYALFSLTFNNVGYKYCGILKCPSKSLIASGRIRKYRERKPYATSVHAHNRFKRFKGGDVSLKIKPIYG